MDIESGNFLNKKLLTLAQTLVLVGAAISATYTVTRIYSRFELQEANDVRLEQKIDDVDARLTKIGGRNADAIKELDNKVTVINDKTKPQEDER